MCAGSRYYILVTLYGARDPVTGLSTGLVHNVSFVTIISLSGDVFMRLPAFTLQPLKQYGAAVVLPDTRKRFSYLTQALMLVTCGCKVK